MVLGQCKSIDTMWTRTGIDEETLQYAMEKYKLLNDQEYIDMDNEYKERMI